MQPIYLDHAATTPLLPEVAAAMDRTARDVCGNPASQHGFGRAARRVVEDARERIGVLLGLEQSSIQADRVIFTSGGTEANNWAVRTLGLADDRNNSDKRDRTASRLLMSAVEHPSVQGPADYCARQGETVERIPVEPNGRIDPARLAAMLERPARLVSVVLGNSETGILQPVAELAALCRERGTLMHTDAVQAIGKIDVNFRELGVDAMTLAAHKFHGPLGIGALVLRSDVAPPPLLFGGFQQEALRPGTESPALVVGMCAALEAWHRERHERTARLANLRDELELRLRTAQPEFVAHGSGGPRLPQTLNIALVGVDRQAMFLALDQVRVACSTGSACASGSSEPSPTLRAMGCSDDALASSLRFSVGATTSAAEVCLAAERILRVFQTLRQGVKAGK
ncbi:MAG: cysteine desulfurase [Pirellula sp.]|nr:cysteine desulfurase [Pirellula sp.]